MASAALPGVSPAQEGHSLRGKLLIFVAHPDDEYAVAGSTYRLVRESGWIADQAIVTDGEAGYRYATLAEEFYGRRLTDKEERTGLAEIRKQEVTRAGKILGIRRHYFLDQQDLGFSSDAAAASSSNWDRDAVRNFLSGILKREKYDVVFTLLPTAETHGHHRTAALLALEAVAAVPEGERPLIFGADVRSGCDERAHFGGLPDHPLTRTVDAGPVIEFDRAATFGYRDELSYQIVVTWVIAEHKSQGLFQNDCGKHRYEEFWLFEASGRDAAHRISSLGVLSNLKTARTVAH
jgi:LmbE family N-acetylglucosaminyl deacetylase